MQRNAQNLTPHRLSLPAIFTSPRHDVVWPYQHQRRSVQRLDRRIGLSDVFEFEPPTRR